MKILDIIVEREGKISGGDADADPTGIGGVPGASGSSGTGLGGIAAGAAGGALAARALFGKGAQPTPSNVRASANLTPATRAALDAKKTLSNLEKQLKLQEAALKNRELALKTAQAELGKVQGTGDSGKIAAATQRIKDSQRAILTTNKTIANLKTNITRTTAELKAAKQNLGFIEKRKYSKVTSAAEAARIERKFASWSKISTVIFKVLGLMVPTTQLYLEYDRIEQTAIAAGNTPEAKATAKTEKDRAWGVFATQVLALKLATALRNANLVRKILKAIKWAGAAVSAPFTAGASIGVSIATDVVIDWAVWWLGTNEGRAFLIDNFKTIIEGGGQFPRGMWDQIVGFYTEASK
jgi:hypothetical protein